ncbi:MAG: hypothetical protein DRH08_05820 [Deltaproteobacteria bacterium]|nr:MAG: hypothetical protein DRH08_05820 [Deltaproteobacteria bacterium]
MHYLKKVNTDIISYLLDKNKADSIPIGNEIFIDSITVLVDDDFPDVPDIVTLIASFDFITFDEHGNRINVPRIWEHDSVDISLNDWVSNNTILGRSVSDIVGEEKHKQRPWRYKCSCLLETPLNELTNCGYIPISEDMYKSLLNECPASQEGYQYVPTNVPLKFGEDKT